MATRKRYTKEFKLEAVRLLEQGDHTAAELARELRVRRNQLYMWQQVLRSQGEGLPFAARAVTPPPSSAPRLLRSVGGL